MLESYRRLWCAQVDEHGSAWILPTAGATLPCRATQFVWNRFGWSVDMFSIGRQQIYNQTTCKPPNIIPVLSSPA